MVNHGIAVGIFKIPLQLFLRLDGPEITVFASFVIEMVLLSVKASEGNPCTAVNPPIFRVTGNNINDAALGIGTVQSRSLSLQHFYPLNGVHIHILTQVNIRHFIAVGLHSHSVDE